MRTVVLLSGGLDSNVCLATVAKDPDTCAISFDYGQSSLHELDCAKKLCEYWNIPHKIIPLNFSQTDTKNEIPARNTIFIANALAYCLEHNYNRILIGAEPDSTFVDSSVEFISEMNKVCLLHGVTLQAPIKNLQNKLEVVKKALQFGVPLHLCHSSRSNLVDGSCKTSHRFLSALETLFPNIESSSLLTELSKLETTSTQFKTRIKYGDLSFKYAAALFELGALSEEDSRLHQVVDVFTTGNWGLALEAAAKVVKNAPTLNVIQTKDLSLLLSNKFSCWSTAGNWGVKQAISCLDRKKTYKVKIIQGALQFAFSSLGIVTTIEHSPFLLNDVSLITNLEENK